VTHTTSTPAPDGDPGEDSGINLDLDEVSVDDLEEITREAVAAVEGRANEAPPADLSAVDTSGQVEVLRQEIVELRDRSMRTLADFDNYRKRAEREREEARRYAVMAPLQDLLEVLDNLRLAIDAGGTAEDVKRGVELIGRQFEEILKRHGVREIVAVGEDFDPVLHEAVARVEDPAVTTATVAAELRRGYRLHERLLRPAMVRVAVPVTSRADPAERGTES
jgi:molecular chaperone GrpE